jgi:opacity protein-like surface antigen
MRKVTFIIVACFLLSIPSSAICDSWTGNINAFLGTKQLDKDDWEPLEEQSEFGVMVDFKKTNWPVSIAIDFLTSSDETTISGITIEGKTSEFAFGVRKIFATSGNFRPFIGGGLANISAELSGKSGWASVSDDDSAMGFWLCGGIYWTFAESFNLGLQLRYSDAEVTLYNIDGEAGGTHTGLLLGYHW